MKYVHKLFVVGARGYIGKRVFHVGLPLFKVIGTSSYESSGLTLLSLDSPTNFDFDLFSPNDVVVLTAAISSPDICSNDYQRAYRVNVTGTSQFISEVISRGSRVIFLSSDTVYGERNSLFGGTEKINPAGVYAQMKVEVEAKYLDEPLFKSIRLSYVFSKEDVFTKYLIACARAGNVAHLFHPFARSIVHRDDVVDGILRLVTYWNNFPQRVINFGGPEVLSRVDFAETLRKYALPNLRFHVVDPGDKFFENRPRIIAMSSEIMPVLLGRPSRTLDEAIQIEFKR